MDSIEAYLRDNKERHSNKNNRFDYNLVKDKAIRPEVLSTLPESEQRAIRGWDKRARAEREKTASLFSLEELREGDLPTPRERALMRRAASMGRVKLSAFLDELEQICDAL